MAALEEHDQVPSDPSVSRDANRTSAHYTREFQRLIDEFAGVPLNVSFRELVGPLPADEHTHSIFPYPARLIRHIPRFVLATQQLTDGVDEVFDPFSGSGTVLVESRLRGFRSRGIDQNPVAALISRVKTTPLDTNEVAEALEWCVRRARSSRGPVLPTEFLRRWYSPAALSALGRLARFVSMSQPGPVHDALSLCLVLTARRVARTDTRISVPVRSERNADASSEDVWRAWRSEGKTLTSRLNRISARAPAASVSIGDARDRRVWPTPELGRSTLLVSSPPYGAAQKYVRAMSLDAGWLGFAGKSGTIELERSSIGREHLSASDRGAADSTKWSTSLRSTLDRISGVNAERGAIYTRYFADMEAVVENAAASQLRRMVLITGTNMVCGEELPTHEFIAELVQTAGFRRIISLRDPIRGRTLLTARRNGTPAPAEFIDVYELNNR